MWIWEYEKRKTPHSFTNQTDHVWRKKMYYEKMCSDSKIKQQKQSDEVLFSWTLLLFCSKIYCFTYKNNILTNVRIIYNYFLKC